MGRPRTTGANLPPGVYSIVSKGKKYFYYSPGRGTERASKAIPLGANPKDPEFWKRLHRAMDRPETTAGTVAALIRHFKTSPDWDYYRPKTKDNYEYNFRKILAVSANVLVCDITPADIYALRDAVAKTSRASANKLLDIFRTLFQWSIKRQYRADDPTAGIKKLVEDVDGTHPWPDEIYNYVLANAPENLRRMAYLGRMTGQREGDLVGASADALNFDGIHWEISKLRDKPHDQPLMHDVLAKLRSWGPGVFLLTERGVPFSEGALRSHWKRWKAEHPELKGMKITIHGLRATAICDRRLAGASEGEISADIGISVGQVTGYTKHIDKIRVARNLRDRRQSAQVLKFAGRTK